MNRKEGSLGLAMKEGSLGLELNEGREFGCIPKERGSGFEHWTGSVVDQIVSNVVVLTLWS